MVWIKYKAIRSKTKKCGWTIVSTSGRKSSELELNLLMLNNPYINDGYQIRIYGEEEEIWSLDESIDFLVTTQSVCKWIIRKKKRYKK